MKSKRFGRLQVVEYSHTHEYPSGAKARKWLCKCDCGNKKIVLENSLKSGNTSSCGCLQKERTSKARRINLTGKVFGKLTVLEFSHSDEKERYYWLCKCECGNEKIINGASLRRGSSNSCGCRQGRFIHGMWGKPGYKAVYLKDPVKKLKHLVGAAVRKTLIKGKSSKNGGRTFDHLPYTPQQLKEHLEEQFEPWMSWENYGGRNDSPQKTWQIDHVKPQASYSFTSMDDAKFQECWSLDNLRPLEKIENIKKGVK